MKTLLSLLLIVTISPMLPAAEVVKEKPEALAARVKEIFRAHCLSCHGGGKVLRAGVHVLDRNLLVKKEKITPGRPDDSILFQLLTATDESVMPPTGQPKLSPEEVETVRKWIAAGPPDFPADVEKPAEVKASTTPAEGTAGSAYVLGKILTHVRTLSPEDRRFVRYFSLNHLLLAGTTAEELEMHREALAKAINHLTWEPERVRPTPIDAPTSTVFALDIRKVGWHQTPFEAFDGGLSLGKSKVNLYDLAVLEYPYAVLPKDSETFDRIAEEYLAPAEMVRPIPYVRADWFVSLATQPTLYEDMLMLPFTLQELEQKLGVDAASNLKTGVARRAGLTVSGVSRNNRVVERHPSRYGFYWKSFDFKSNRGLENIFRDPIDFKESGGEMIFSLPNGFQGYYVSDSKGNRLESAPTEIVVDKFAEDKIVRNGLSCIRCHDQGLKTFSDTVRPALVSLTGSAAFDKRQAMLLYPEQSVMDDLVKKDTAKFQAAMTEVLGHAPGKEPLTAVTRRYMENPLTLATAAGELGLTETGHLDSVFRAPAFAGIGLLPLTTTGVIRRDAWEEYFDSAVRGLGIGMPVVPLDGTLCREYPAVNPPFDLTLTTNKKTNIFEPGDELRITVTNNSDRTVFVELVGTSAKGKKVLLVNAKTKLEPGKSLTFPKEDEPAIKIKGGLGKERVTLFASDTEFLGGQILRGKDVTDRFLHTFQTLEKKDGRTLVTGDTTRIVKKTLEIETR